MKAIDVIAKIGKVILGIVLGLFFSFVTIVCLEVLLPKPNPFRKEGLNLWLVAPIIIAWLALTLWLALRNWSGGKIHTDNIEHLPGSVAELIDAVIEAMGYRRSARAEVRQELTDHFTDAMADCGTEQEKQVCIKELIGEFGDAKLLGILLRRGKKRCRPLWQKALSGLKHAAWISVVLLILYIGWFFTGTPEISTNYLTAFNKQARPAADESLNAWPYYEKAAQSYVKYDGDEQDDEEFDDSPRRLSTLSEIDRQTLTKWLSDNRSALELIVQGNQQPYCWREYVCWENESTELMSVLLPNLSELRRIARLMCWQAHLNAEEGQFDAALNHLLETYTLGQHIRGENTMLIEQLVAMAIESISTNNLRLILHEYGDRMTAEQLDSARTRLAKVAENSKHTIDFDSEKLLMYDEAQRSFTRSRFGKSHLYFRRLQQVGPSLGDSSIDEDPIKIAKMAFHVLFTHPGKEETLQQVDTFYAEMERFSDMTPAAAKTNSEDIDEQMDELMQDNFFLGVLMPAISKVVLISHRSRSETEATLTILAVAQYEKQIGQLPE
ncbi:MAG: hypothetical protein ACYTER_11490, partial [Planctomycetota bacterium]